MKRREFLLQSAFLASLPTFSGCLNNGDNKNNSGGISYQPSHYKYLYNPKDTEASGDSNWSGYVLTNLADFPEHHPWHQVHEEFGIKMNLKNYGVSNDLTDAGYSDIDTTIYSTENQLMSSDPDREIQIKQLKPIIRWPRPSSTGGFLKDQEIVDTINGFNIYERGAAVNKEELALISGPSEHIRKDVIPAIVNTDTDDLDPFIYGDADVIFNKISLGMYNEVGYHASDLHPTWKDTGITSYARASEIEAKGQVLAKQIEVYENEEQVKEEPIVEAGLPDEDIVDTEIDGRTITYTIETDELVIAGFPGVSNTD